jgi:ribosome-binding protein aMBF1 (putative translation factor)
MLVNMKIYYREDIEKIVRKRLEKTSQKDLALELGIHKSILNRFLKGKDGLEVIAERLGFERLKGFLRKKEQTK